MKNHKAVPFDTRKVQKFIENVSMQLSRQEFRINEIIYVNLVISQIIKENYDSILDSKLGRDPAGLRGNENQKYFG